MKDKSYKPGDLVVLVSGGPVMAVQEPTHQGMNTFRCTWFAGKKLEHGVFEFETLRAATDEDKAKK